MSRITEVRSGGQSGADRGAMDAALSMGFPISGWCPKGGWAEDYPDPPGVLTLYPQMVETPSSDVTQRTEWNIRESTCCITLNSCQEGTSPGTDAGFVFYEKYGIPHFEIYVDGQESIEAQTEQAYAWLDSLNDDAIVLGFGGPRASEYPGIYDIAFGIVKELLEKES